LDQLLCFQSRRNLECGSYFQDPIRTREWIQVVGTVDAAKKITAIYKNGEFRHSDSYQSETPVPGPAGLASRYAAAGQSGR
jgi:hypothetical protein